MNALGKTIHPGDIVEVFRYGCCLKCKCSRFRIVSGSGLFRDDDGVCIFSQCVVCGSWLDIHKSIKKIVQEKN